MCHIYQILNEPTHLDLFSGIGGFALAAKWAGFRTVGFCEIDKYCQKVLAKNFLADAERKRISDWGRRKTVSTQDEMQRDSKEWEWLWTDSWQRAYIRTCGNIFDLDGRQFRGVDLITGGFPCQSFSVAGNRRGAADDRALWPEMFRVIMEARPAWVLGENVPGIISMELDNVLSDLEGFGYATRTLVIPACAVDAKHRRDRAWVIAKSESQQGSSRDNGREQGATGEPEQVEPGGGNCRTLQRCDWLPEPDVGRVAHGIPSRVDRLKGLGNAVVPQVAYEILREIGKEIAANSKGI